MIRHALARACRLIAHLGLGWGEWWADLADRIDGTQTPPVRGIGA